MMVPTLKWGQPFILSALILERGSNGLLTMPVKELRRIQNSSGKGCGNHSITLGENKQGWVPLIHGCPFLSAFSGWIWTQPVERMRPAGTCLLSFPRCGWESGSCLGLHPVILPPQEGHTCQSICFQKEGVQAGSFKEMKTMPRSFGALHLSFLPHHPSLFLHVHCFADLRFSHLL